METNVKSKLLGLEEGEYVILTVVKEGKNERRYQGLCTFHEQNAWTEDDYVCLTDAVDIDQNIKSIQPHFFLISNILCVEIISPSGATSCIAEKEIKDGPIEEILQTTVITQSRQFEELVENLNNVQVLGFALEGSNVGRFGTVKWVNLLVKRTIVALQIEPLSMDMGGEYNVWSKIKSTIFNNPRLVKVVHDCRAAADYLFHRHSISIQNVFDTMVADVYYLKATTSSHPYEFKSLSKCLENYLPERIHPQELNLLREYEEDSRSESGWLIEPLPSPQILKVGAIKIKYLLTLREILMWKMMEGCRSSVNSHIDYVLSN